MPDLLVSLYSTQLAELKQRADSVGASIRPALPPELHLVVTWVRERFSENWASEVLVAFSRQPVACLIAIEGRELLGFACYDTTARGFFGPTGVDPQVRGKGVGLALFSACLQTMKTLGHAYAFIGDAGPVDFYGRTAGAITIPAPDKGIYEGMLRSMPK
ncbi:GCN5-related N-acetyltransferase protein (plasmid) [Rhizobium phaseoli]|uniref:GCN5-related N-acetyltransferase protein n=1 Tax=Rhizobium phaseoli TaxID=396 RepID=A0A192THZ1_9HYPH|nr:MULTISPECIES: GNAT family N-acetyltransferase [Rhizobium]ANK94767.1 GCN5-related N-acetyltransferase protein [Rhizobium sp. N6212]ANL00817.1 GCN5-related N-acetyltransferase protein [Rhizobium sp. N621]ANL06938.1 GCN5-related N-acetyltransferase protein [Rhizobium esperanzae]ANL13108.1 GCN5-related N-acetyltransferase protein [Rhizobium sp. N1341]ANL25092.1 GCN5-related N-acetyltransferase protein [Rhizobium sp. N113]